MPSWLSSISKIACSKSTLLYFMPHIYSVSMINLQLCDMWLTIILQQNNLRKFINHRQQTKHWLFNIIQRNLLHSQFVPKNNLTSSRAHDNSCRLKKLVFLPTLCTLSTREAEEKKNPFSFMHIRMPSIRCNGQIIEFSVTPQNHTQNFYFIQLYAELCVNRRIYLGVKCYLWNHLSFSLSHL